jgi:hypothetical protein
MAACAASTRAVRREATAFASATTQALAGAFMIARTHPGLRSEMPGTGEAAHVGSDLGEKHFGQAPLDPWNRLLRLVHSRGNVSCSLTGVKLRKGKERLKAGGRGDDKESFVVRR